MAPFEGPFAIVKLDLPNVYLHSRSQQEFQVHIDALSGLTKDFLEAGHTITSTRKRPYDFCINPALALLPKMVTASHSYPMHSWQVAGSEAAPVKAPEITVSKPQTGKPYLAELPPTVSCKIEPTPAKIDSKKAEVREPTNRKRSGPRWAEQFSTVKFIHLYRNFTEETATGASGGVLGLWPTGGVIASCLAVGGTGQIR